MPPNVMLEHTYLGVSAYHAKLGIMVTVLDILIVFAVVHVGQAHMVGKARRALNVQVHVQPIITVEKEL